MDSDQRPSPRSDLSPDRLLTRTIILSIVAFFLVILLISQVITPFPMVPCAKRLVCRQNTFWTVTQFNASRLSITLQEGNFDSRTTIQNVTITDVRGHTYDMMMYG